MLVFSLSPNCVQDVVDSPNTAASDAVDAVPAVDVLQIAKEAADAGTANWVQKECVKLPERLNKAKERCEAHGARLKVCFVFLLECICDLAVLSKYLSGSDHRVITMCIFAACVDVLAMQMCGYMTVWVAATCVYAVSVYVYVCMLIPAFCVLCAHCPVVVFVFPSRACKLM